MTNVMAYLAARSLPGVQSVPADDGTPMPLVRPRVPSRYETEGADLSIPTQDLEHKALPAEPAPAMRRQATRPIGEPQAESKAPPKQPGAAVRRSADASVEPAPRRRVSAAQAEPGAVRRADQAAPPAPSRAAELKSGDPTPTTPSVPRAATPARPRPPEYESGEAPDRQGPRRLAPRETTEDRLRTQASGDATTTQEAARPAPAPAPIPAAPPAQAAGALRLPSVVPRQADTRRGPAHARDAAEALAPAPPRVQVTIGRLEIRAASIEPPPTRRSEPPAPSMSLDDYLANRAKG
jgi:hypothetical protein